MAVDDLFEIAPEVSIECHGGTVGFRQRDRFREQAARLRLRRTEHCHRSRAVFDDDFRASAHVGQERRDIGRGSFLFRNVDYALGHKLIIHRNTPRYTRILPYTWSLLLVRLGLGIENR
jgi:hypothetical protein